MDKNLIPEILEVAQSMATEAARRKASGQYSPDAMLQVAAMLVLDARHDMPQPATEPAKT